MKKTFLPYLFSALMASAGYQASACLAPYRLTSDSIIVKPSEGAGKSTIRLLPNLGAAGMLTISSDAAEELHFYIFDVEGNLICGLTLKQKDKQAIPPLKKGLYTYDVFRNETSIEQGEIVAK